ncbi:MAG: hypothetical protein JO194_10570 [Candidatus Eremiobacteraeota bacterium]|nr:hypothetical protein [Candidatus Eremiobacteraeota bacterium]
MRIAVCVAAVPNPVKVKWDRFRQLLDRQDAEMMLNAADRNALEVAAQLAKAAGAQFDAYSAGVGAANALREAAVFGVERLIAIDDPSLVEADAGSVAGVLAAAITKDGGADVIACGAATSSNGSGAVPGFLSVLLNAGLRADVIALAPHESGLQVTAVDGASLVRSAASLPLVLAAAPFGIKTRAVSPILLMRASKRPIDTQTTVELADARSRLPLPALSSGATDGPFESNRKRRLNEVVDGPDAQARAITLASALRERHLV